MLNPVRITTKSPVTILSLNSDSDIITKRFSSVGKSILVKQAATSKYHGQISRDAQGNVDLVAEMKKHPDALWIKTKAIEADVPNDNGDFFPTEEVRKYYKTFEGVPVFTNHENSDVEKAKGKVVLAEWDEDTKSVFCTMFIDRKAYGALCRAIEEGYITDVSMGTQVGYSVCSHCENRAATEKDYCTCVKTLKGRSLNGKKVYERNYDLKFIELSVVVDGACEDCTIREILTPDEFLQKVADAVTTTNKMTRNNIITDAIQQTAGQEEIQKLNQAMDLLEEVIRTMLDQKQFIDLEFAKKLMDVLADLQSANDELVDAGYARMGQQTQQQNNLVPPPTNLKDNQNQIANQENIGGTTGDVGTGTSGVGTITGPAMANKIKEMQVKIANLINDMKEKQTVENSESTKAKLASIWKTPTIKSFQTKITDGDYEVVIGADDIVGMKGSQKLASVKISSLDPEIQKSLKSGEAHAYIIDGLKSIAAKGASTVDQITEKQLEPKREDKTPEVITQKQLEPKREDKAPEVVTEKQLKEKQEDKVVEVTTEKQLKEKQEDKTPEVITEKQLADNKTDKFVEGLTTEKQLETTTEKQLEAWGRKIASKDDAIKATAAAFKAFAKTSVATGATPDELVAIASELTASAFDILSAEKSVDAAKDSDLRSAALARAKFHGTSKIASKKEVSDYLLGSMCDAGMCGQVAVQVMEVLAETSTTSTKIAEAITEERKTEKSVKQASGKDFLRAALATEEVAKDEEVSIIFSKASLKDKDAFEMAKKVAAKNGLVATAKLAVKEDGDKVTITVSAKKAEIKQDSLEDKKESVAARSNARKEVVAQMGGAMPTAPGAGGTTMPPPAADPAGAGGPPPATPPVSNMSAEPTAPVADEASDSGEPTPPFTKCYVCHSEDVQAKGGEWDCNNCGASGTGEFVIKIKNYPNFIEDSKKKEGNEGEEGLGDMGGGPGTEMPPIGLAAKFKISPEMVKKAGAKQIASFCPHCSSEKVKLAMKQGSGSGRCDVCKGTYKVDITASKNGELEATVQWPEMNIIKHFAAKHQESKKLATKKASLQMALKTAGLTEQYVKSGVKEKAEIIATLVDKGLLAK